MILTLPVPPSVNHCFVNVHKRGRVKSKAYTAWRKDAGWALQTQPHAKVPGAVHILIQIKRIPRADIDNRVKQILDLLVLHHVIDDDKNVASVKAEWADVPEGCRVTVEAA